MVNGSKRIQAKTKVTFLAPGHPEAAATATENQNYWPYSIYTTLPS